MPEFVPDPPGAWAPIYERIASNDDLRWRTLADVIKAVQLFLDPVLAGEALKWRTGAWTWSTPKGHER